MATKKEPTLDLEEILDEEEDLEEQEDMQDVFEADLTTAVPIKQQKYSGPRVPVFIPALDDPGDGGIKVDQYEHVTIANERGETCYKVRRGETVEVPVPVFIALKARYPKL